MKRRAAGARRRSLGHTAPTWRRACGVAQGDFDERWVVMWRARQHGDAQAGPHKSAQGFVLFALEGKVWDESRSLAQRVKHRT